MGIFSRPPVPEREREDFRIDLPGMQFAVNHMLKTCFLYNFDSAMSDAAFDELEQHLAHQGYFLQVIVAARGLPLKNEQE